MEQTEQKPSNKELMEKALSTVLTVDAPQEIYAEIARIEAWAYYTVKQQAKIEHHLAELEAMRRERTAKAYDTLKEEKLTIPERQARVEQLTTGVLSAISKEESELKYWRAMGKVIENKVSLAQSILSNIGSQIKAGMYFDNIK